jgi:hypothetical protein
LHLKLHFCSDFLRRYQQQADSRGIRLGNPKRKEIVVMKKMEVIFKFF